jgi:hypothetical protein
MNARAAAAALDFTAATSQLDPCAKLSKLAPFMHAHTHVAAVKRKENGQFKTRHTRTLQRGRATEQHTIFTQHLRTNWCFFNSKVSKG